MYSNDTRVCPVYVFPLSSGVLYPSSNNITSIMALSIAFTVLYMFGIPSYLYYLIKKAVGEVDRNLGTERLYDEIKEVKSKKAEGWEKAAKQLEDDAQKKYQEAVNAYQQAASTLYSSYERKFRYYKIIVLVEKLILIMVCSIRFFYAAKLCFSTVAFPQGLQVNLLLSNAFLIRHFPNTFNQELQGLQIQKLLTAIVIIAFLIFALVSRPFLDTQEDFMDITCRIVNM